MRFFSSAVYLTALVTLLTSNPISAAAVPFNAEHAHLEKRAPPYPDDAGIRRALTDFEGPSVFFSNLAPKTQAERDAPDTFAETVNGRTVKRAFGNQPIPRQNRLFTDQWPGPGRAPNYQDFADRFSRIFAEKAKGDTAFVLLRALDGDDGPKARSVWTVHELPALKANTNIKRIIRVNPADFNDQQQIFPETEPEQTPPPQPTPVTPPADPADPATGSNGAPPQLKPRRLRLGGLGGLRLPKLSKPSKPASPERPATSKPAPPEPAPSSKPAPPPPSSSAAKPTTSSPPPSSTSANTPASASSSPTSAAAPSTTSQSITTSSTTSGAATTTTGPSTLSSSTTTSASTSTTSTARTFVVLNWDNPKDGPYYKAILL